MVFTVPGWALDVYSLSMRDTSYSRAFPIGFTVGRSCTLTEGRERDEKEVVTILLTGLQPTPPFDTL